MYGYHESLSAHLGIVLLFTCMLASSNNNVTVVHFPHFPLLNSFSQPFFEGIKVNTRNDSKPAVLPLGQNSLDFIADKSSARCTIRNVLI